MTKIERENIKNELSTAFHEIFLRFPIQSNYLYFYYYRLRYEIDNLDTSDGMEVTFKRKAEELFSSIELYKAISDYAIKLEELSIFRGDIRYFEMIHLLHNDMDIELSELEPNILNVEEEFKSMFNMTSNDFEKTLIILEKIEQNDELVRRLKIELKELLMNNRLIDAQKELNYRLLSKSLTQDFLLKEYHEIANILTRSKGRTRVLKR